MNFRFTPPHHLADLAIRVRAATRVCRVVTVKNRILFTFFFQIKRIGIRHPAPYVVDVIGLAAVPAGFVRIRMKPFTLQLPERIIALRNRVRSFGFRSERNRLFEA